MGTGRCPTHGRVSKHSFVLKPCRRQILEEQDIAELVKAAPTTDRSPPGGVRAESRGDVQHGEPEGKRSPAFPTLPPEETFRAFRDGIPIGQEAEEPGKKPEGSRSMSVEIEKVAAEQVHGVAEELLRIAKRGGTQADSRDVACQQVSARVKRFE